MKKKLLFIVNPISGHHNKDKFPALVDRLIDKEMYDYDIVFTERARHATELANKAIEDQYDIIASVGGDGTINEIACCLIEKKQTLVIIPFGSGNGLARHLNLPLQPEKVITEVLNKGKAAKIDTAVMNGTPFISIAGVGFDALIADFFARDPHRGLRTYAKIVTEEYPQFKPEHYTLILNDSFTVECDPLMISFANSNQFGYNAAVSPKAKLDDGLLDVCIFKKPTLIEAPYVAIKLMEKKIDRTSYVEIHQASKIQVIRSKEAMANIDGEAIAMNKDILIEVNPLSLNILLPDKQ